MRDDTQMMLFMAHVPWDCGVLTGMGTGAHGLNLTFLLLPYYGRLIVVMVAYLKTLPTVALPFLVCFFPLSYLA